ncbi:MAG: InlB B-repeat-containing protein [Oscillospiraceae bacterium]|nr:InlB B-repeat-containing protein [Oscillospiraceae bacterium]
MRKQRYRNHKLGVTTKKCFSSVMVIILIAVLLITPLVSINIALAFENISIDNAPITEGELFTVSIDTEGRELALILPEGLYLTTPGVVYLDNNVILVEGIVSLSFTAVAGTYKLQLMSMDNEAVGQPIILSVEEQDIEEKPEEITETQNDSIDTSTQEETIESDNVIITNFIPLPDEILWQGYDFGEIDSIDGLVLPDSLDCIDIDANLMTITNIEWQSDTRFDPYISMVYSFSPVLPEGYDLNDGTSIPVITVIVRMVGGIVISPLALGDIIVTGGNMSNSSFSTISEAVNAINTDAAGDYLILVSTNITITAALTINVGRNVTISSDQGNQHVITQTGKARHFIVNGSLSLTNIILAGMGLTNGTDSAPNGGIQVKEGGSLYLNSESIIELCSSGSGGGIQNSKDGIVEVNGGFVINNNSSTTATTSTFGVEFGGGGIHNAGTLTINSGSISKNTATNGGGIANSNVLVINNGLVSENTTRRNGAGVINYQSGVVSMNNGEISFNQCWNGAGVLNSSGEFTINGGKICNNTALYFGGGITNVPGLVTINGGEICHNTAGNSGAGVYFQDRVIMNGGRIADNITLETGSSMGGGGVFIIYGNFVMNGGEIAGNHSAYGGGILAEADSIVTINNNALIRDNTASNGGGIYCASTNANAVTINGGQIIDNMATSNGGGIWITDSRTNLNRLKVYEGSVFSNNKANVAYDRNSADDGIYAQQIGNSGAGILWTVPFSQGYNNYDISYVYGSAISEYSVTYNGNGNTGGSVPSDSTGPYLRNSLVEVLDNTGNLTNTNYTFSGWNTESDGTGISYAVGSSFTITSDTVLYAVWTANMFDVKYIVSGIVPASVNNMPVTPQSKQQGSSFTVEDNLTTDKNSYNGALGSWEFNGWESSDVTISEAGSVFEMPASDVIITGSWVFTPFPTYSVTYIGNGNTGGSVPVDSDSPYYTGSSIAILGNERNLTRTSYTFLGWATTQNGTNTYQKGDTLVITADITLYAVWRLNAVPTTYTVTYQAGTNGTFPTQATNGLLYGDSTPDAPTVTGETGWRFTGWSPVVNAIVTGNMTYTAQWEQLVIVLPTYYTVQFVDWNNTLIKTEQVPVNGNAIAPADPVREGYTFVGYDKAFNNVTENLIVKALYTILTVKLPETAVTTEPLPTPPPIIDSSRNDSALITLDSTEVFEKIREEGIPTLTIGSMEIPLVAGSMNSYFWALMNLVLAITGALVATLASIRTFNVNKQTKHKNADEHTLYNENQQRHRKLLWVTASVIAGIIGVVLFILTEDISKLMALFDRWTIIHAVILVFEIVGYMVTLKNNKDKVE